MSLLVLYQWTHSEVIFSTSARVSSGPVRNGEPSRVHSVLYNPTVVSARALSSASPTVPIDGASPASISVSVKCTLVYWLPHPSDEWRHWLPGSLAVPDMRWPGVSPVQRTWSP